MIISSIRSSMNLSSFPFFTDKLSIILSTESFLRNKISGAPVLNEKDELVGVLSEKDCMKTLIEYSYYNNLGGLVEEYMSTNLETINVHDTLSDVADKFMQSRFRRFPVLDGNKLVGQVSRRDILRAVFKLSHED